MMTLTRKLDPLRTEARVCSKVLGVRMDVGGFFKNIFLKTEIGQADDSW